MKFWKSMIRDCQTYIGTLAAQNEQKQACTHGHVIGSTWSGHLPKCNNCGALVQSPDELRKAAS